MDTRRSTSVNLNILSLQKIQGSINTAQNRIASGIRVTSAVEDPKNWFLSRSLSDRANDLLIRLDDMTIATKTIDAAINGINSILNIFETMHSINTAASESSDATERHELFLQFMALRRQGNAIARDSVFNGINLLAGESLSVRFNEDGSSLLELTAVDYSTNFEMQLGGGADFGGGWADLTAGDDRIAASAVNITNGMNTLRELAQRFGNSLTVVRVREEFTKDLIDLLRAGADDLVLADQNEEAANILALQTRQQLAFQSLSIASGSMPQLI